MKSINKKRTPINVLAEARRSVDFRMFSNDAGVRIRLASEVFNSRKEKDLSQSELAKIIHSTQKVVSKIESGDTNIGIELLNRIVKELNFNSESLCRVFDCCLVVNWNFRTGDSEFSSEYASKNGLVNNFNSLQTNFK
jgi:transcriptional regulator with XRE-family HTH domain